jgi:hypothetical protein
VKECCVDMCLWRLVVNSSATSKITNKFVGKLDIFCVQFVGRVFFSIDVFNNLNISHSFPGENVKGECSLLSTTVFMCCKSWDPTECVIQMTEVT